MTELAVVILAHGDPVHLQRLVDALDDVPVFLHVDAKTSPAVCTAMIANLPRRVVLVERVSASLASWSLVEAELRGLRSALEATRAEHIAVLSGADYPLASVSDLVRELGPWRGHSYMWNTPLPYPAWDTRRHPDGGLWRLRFRFLTHRDRVLYLRDVPLRLPVPRALPQGVELRASSQWKILARHHVQALLDAVDRRPDLVRFWRSTLVPDETFVASVLGSPSVVDRDPLPACTAQPWFIRWEPGAYHPFWLDEDDFDDLVAAREGARMTPATAFEPSTERDRPGPKLFARKLSAARSPGLVDRIDAELRS